jgi:hypothetical protein
MGTTDASGYPSWNCSSPIACRITRSTDGQVWNFVKDSARSSSYMTSSSYRSTREADNACISTAQWNAGRGNGGYGANVPCYAWQSPCP